MSKDKGVKGESIFTNIWRIFLKTAWIWLRSKFGHLVCIIFGSIRMDEKWMMEMELEMEMSVRGKDEK